MTFTIKACKIQHRRRKEKKKKKHKQSSTIKHTEPPTKSKKIYIKELAFINTPLEVKVAGEFGALLYTSELYLFVDFDPEEEKSFAFEDENKALCSQGYLQDLFPLHVFYVPDCPPSATTGFWGIEGILPARFSMY